MNPMLPRVRLYLLGGAALVFFGGLMLAMGRWNQAEADRAFVEAAARAAQVAAAPAATGMRYWAPVSGAQPPPVARARIEATEQRRVMPPMPAQPARPAQAPADKPAAMPR